MDNSFSIVNFGNSLAQKVTNKGLREDLLERLADYRISPSEPFGKHYSKISALSDLKDLRKNKKEEATYLVSYQFTDMLKPAFLFFTRYSGIRFCFLFHKDAIYAVKYRFNERIYDQDTLLEGYIVTTVSGNKCHFVVSDIVLYQNRVVDTDIQERLKLMNKLIDTEYQPDPILDVADIVLNDHVQFNQLESFLVSYKQPYTSGAIGIVFTPITSDAKNYYLNFKEINKLNLPQHKQIESTSQPINDKLDPTRIICFKIQRTDKPDVYQLYLQDEKNERYFDIASVPDKDTSILVSKILGKYQYTYVKCKYDDNFSRWQPFMKSSRKSSDQLKVVKVRNN